MRPLYLSIEGINSFFSKQEINFEDFSSDNIFCICGPTGSGKTTILDCIILALYGDGSRTDLISEYISLGLEKAEVVFRFEFDHNLWEVRRSFNKNGAGKCYLINLSKNIIAADRPENVNAAVKALVKLERNEFTQVVILEQGKFAKFLSAKKAERSNAISQLFSLYRYEGLYNKFSDVLKKFENKIEICNESLKYFSDISEEILKEKQAENESVILEEKQTSAHLKSVKKSLLENAARKEKYESYKVSAEKLEAVMAALAALESQKENNDKLFERLACEETAKNAAKDILEKSVSELKNVERIAEEKKIYDKKESEKILKEKEAQNLKNKWQKINAEKEQTDKNLTQKTAEFGAVVSALNFDLSADLSGGFEPVFGRLADADKMLNLGLQTKGNLKLKFEEIKQKEKTALKDKAEKFLQKTEIEKIAESLKAECEKAEKEYENADAELKKCRDVNMAAHLCEGLKKGDTCPVCGGEFVSGASKADENYPVLNEKIKMAEEALKTVNKKREELQAKHGSICSLYESSINECEKLEREAQSVKEQFGAVLTFGLSLKEDEYNKNIENVNKAKNILSQIFSFKKASEQAASDIESIDKDIRNLLSRSAELGQDISQWKNANLKQLTDLSAAQMNIRETIEKAKTVIDEYEKNLERAKILAAEIEKKEAALKSGYNIYKADAEKLKSFDFDYEAAAKLENEFKETEEKLNKLIAVRSALTADIARIVSGLEKKKKLEDDLKYFTKKHDTAKILCNLFKGNKFLEYIEEEYIHKFTSDASKKLFELSNGKYKLEYFEEGNKSDFWVVDYLRGGQKRKVKTLSGGETFLASISLAIAISSRISCEKNYGFFFLDEGFGTLDESTIEIAAEALYKLSEGTLVGVVSHRAELIEKIPTRLKVSPPKENEGSCIKIEHA